MYPLEIFLQSQAQLYTIGYHLELISFDLGLFSLWNKCVVELFWCEGGRRGQIKNAISFKKIYVMRLGVALWRQWDDGGSGKVQK